MTSCSRRNFKARAND